LVPYIYGLDTIFPGNIFAIRRRIWNIPITKFICERSKTLQFGGKPPKQDSPGLPEQLDYIFTIDITPGILGIIG